jgi:hypothetical protein
METTDAPGIVLEIPIIRNETSYNFLSILDQIGSVTLSEVKAMEILPDIWCTYGRSS